MLPTYKLTIDPNDNSGVTFNALVDVPAHMKSFVYFGKENPTKYSFNEESRIVTGVMMAAGVLIYRRDEHFGEHNVIFDAETITQIKERFHKNLFNNNVNAMHNSDMKLDGVYMISSYQIGGDKNPKAPEIFASQNLNDGTWIASYKIENDEVWAKVKSGEFNGFSVEGEFYKEKVNLKQQTNMKKERKTIFEFLFGKADKATDKFASATTTDGVVLMYEGELAEGTAVFIEADGNNVQAKDLAGDHQITLEDGTMKVITLDEQGIVTAIVDAENMEADDDELRAEVVEAMKAFAKDTNERFAKIEKENQDLKAEIKAIKEAKESKFGKDPKVENQGGKKTISEILKS